MATPPPQPAFTVEEFLAFDAPFDAAIERIRSFGGDWPRAVDSLRPIAQALWMAMDEDQKRSFLAHYRHPWEIHRHRIAAEIGRDLDRWIAEGRFAVHGAAIQRVEREGGRLRIVAETARGRPTGSWSPSAPTPTQPPARCSGPRSGTGWLRPARWDCDRRGSATGRVLDANGEPTLPAYAMGRCARASCVETISGPGDPATRPADVARRLLAVPAPA